MRLKNDAKQEVHEIGFVVYGRSCVGSVSVCLFCPVEMEMEDDPLANRMGPKPCSDPRGPAWPTHASSRLAMCTSSKRKPLLRGVRCGVSQWPMRTHAMAQHTPGKAQPSSELA
jgi:hypothetical protein